MRRVTFEQRLEQLLPKDWTSFDLTFHGLLREAEGGWSVNDSWRAYRDNDRAEAIRHLKGRWEIFKLNYHSKARVRDIVDVGDADTCLLEVDCIALATVEEGGAQ